MRAIVTAAAIASMLLAASTVTTGCSVFRKSSDPLTATPASGTAATASGDQTVSKALAGDWTIIDVKGHQVSSAPGTEAPHMGFAPSQDNPGWIDFYAYNGCNFINGVVALKGSKISKQGDFAATMRLCPDAEYEMAISTALEQMKTLKIERINNESFLYLIDGGGQTVLTLRKHNLNFLEGAWAVRSIDGDKLPEGVDIRFVVDLQTNTLHGNAGCNVVNGLVKVNMAIENGIGFTDLVTTRMTCPDIAYETRFLQTMARVAKATGNETKAQLLDTDGKVIITLDRLSKADLAANR